MRKIQRIDSSTAVGLIVRAPGGDDAKDAAGDGVRMERGVVTLSSADVHTACSFADAAITNSYNVRTGTFQLTGSDRSGVGYFSTTLQTKELYARLGIERRILDPRATAQSVVALNSPGLRGQDASPDTPLTQATPAPALRLAVDRELRNLVTYGPCRLVTASITVDGDTETQDYRVDATRSGEHDACFAFVSIETNKRTGRVVLSASDVSRTVAEVLETTVDESDFGEALRLAGTKSVVGENFKLEFISSKRAGPNMYAQVPTDNFTEGHTCYVFLGPLCIV